MLWLSIALVVVAALAHDAFRRWLSREQDTRVAELMDWARKAQAEAQKASATAANALGQVELLGADIVAKLSRRVGDVEKQLVRRVG